MKVRRLHRAPPTRGADDSDPPVEHPTYAAGEVIADKYELVSVLGRGGMGAVWLARNLSLNVDVAIKLILSEATSRAASARLLREAQAAARLNHPSSVRVFDFGETSHGDPFIVMEVVRGESLADLLDRRLRLNAINAVRTLLPVASALAAAHLRGIVHRDLKPENVILVTGDEGTLVPKLVDFGIAKVQDEQPTDHAPARPLTQDGSILGTPDYMSPEQVRASHDVDERTDIWSFCVLLYETITGRRPFEGANGMAIFGAILADDPIPITDLGAGDDLLWSVIAQGLAKRARDRPPSMRALGRMLANWLRSQAVDVDVAGQSLALHWLREGQSAIDQSFPPSHQPHASAAPTTPSVVTVSTAPELASITLETQRPATRLRRWVPMVGGAAALIVGGGVWFALSSDEAPMAIEPMSRTWIAVPMAADRPGPDVLEPPPSPPAAPARQPARDASSGGSPAPERARTAPKSSVRKPSPAPQPRRRHVSKTPGPIEAGF